MTDRHLREMYGELLDSAGQMYWEIDRDFRVIYANRLLKECFGDPVGQTCFGFMKESHGPCKDCPVEKVFAGSDRAVSERMRTAKNGSAIWLQHTATSIKDAKGNTTGACELMIDVTHSRNVEAWLRDSERLYRHLVEQVPDVIFSLDPEGRFTFVNTQVEKFLGHPVQDILETPLEDYVVEEDKARVETILLVKSEEVWDEEVGILDSQGNRKHARIRCSASFDERSRLLGFDGVLRDRTERRKLEEDLKSSRHALVEKIRIIDELYEHIVQSGKCKAIEEHTAEVAHELRQPLAIVGGFARRMLKQIDSTEVVDMEKQRRHLEIIIAEVERLERILDGLIDFTRRDVIHLQSVNPNDLIEYILGVTQNRISEKRLKVEKNLGAEIGDMPLDPGRFQQLVLNLVSNAIDASPFGGVIEIETGASIPSDKAAKTGELKTDTFFELKVRNMGPEIPDADLQQIFNPFYTTKQHGTGLGLTVSKKIVEDHWGSISAKSDENGTTFTIWLPVTEHPDRNAVRRPDGQEIEGPSLKSVGSSSK